MWVCILRLTDRERMIKRKREREREREREWMIMREMCFKRKREYVLKVKDRMCF